MEVSKLTKFVFDEVDLQNGSVTVRFINPYGVIETGQKTLDDFKTIIQVETGSFLEDGTPIMRPQQIILNNNPNEDLIFAYDIPLDEQEQFVNGDELIEYIARQYPDKDFEDMQKRKTAEPRPDLEQLKTQRFDVEVVRILNEQPSDPAMQVLNYEDI